MTVKGAAVSLEIGAITGINDKMKAPEFSEKLRSGQSKFN